ncbi:MAG TPA: DUF11 domain-containing protein, partial [Candidatus Methanoperedenaceae archaeon]|nr:DUF11 domain-containing protein [Candidatus Methanoperedenaceae archaeon]
RNSTEIYNDDVRFTAVELPSSSSLVWVSDTYDPWAKVSMELRGKPTFEITVATDKNEYKATDSSIAATVTIRNSGTADASDVVLTMDGGGLKFNSDSSTSRNYGLIEKAKPGETFSTKFDIPMLWDSTDYTIYGRIAGKDIKGKDYVWQGGKTIRVVKMWDLSFSKTATSNMFMRDTAVVSLSLQNKGIVELNSIMVSDTVPPGFELKEKQDMVWTIESLSVGGTWTTTYSLKPVEPSKGGHTIPAAFSTFKNNGKSYNTASNTAISVVHGTKINITKTLNASSMKGEQAAFEVTVTAKNVGDLKANVDVVDSQPLPPNVTYVSGNTSYIDKILNEGESMTFSYIIAVNQDDDGEIRLPAASASFINLMNDEGTSLSSMPAINVTSNKPKLQNTQTGGQPQGGTQVETSSGTSSGNPGATEAKDTVTPGFEGVFASAVLLLVYALSRRR